MGIDEKNILGEDVLQGVTGGAGGTAFDAKRKEFDDVWETLGMEQKGFTGMKRSELFDEWQMSGSTLTAISFLSKNYN